MSALLDVNLLLACGWQTHPEHARALAWLDLQSEFFTCPLVELGFISGLRSRFEFPPASPLVEARSAIGNRHDFFSHRRATVLAERAEEAVVGVLLEDVRRPPAHARDGEDGREEIGRNAE